MPPGLKNGVGKNMGNLRFAASAGRAAGKIAKLLDFFGSLAFGMFIQKRNPGAG
jgi:hypothetical protein